MFKIYGALIIIISLSIYGIIISLKQKRRCITLKNLIRCAKYISLETSYRKTRCEIILKEASEMFSLPFLNDVIGMLKEFGIYNSFKKALDDYSDEMSLTDEDKKAAYSVSSLFSYSDNEQINAANSTIKLLELSFNDAKITYDNKSKLIRTGSLLFGILIAVLLF